MCQFCNLTRLSSRVAPLGTQPRSLSYWSHLPEGNSRDVGLPRHSERRRFRLAQAQRPHSYPLLDSLHFANKEHQNHEYNV